MNDGQYSGEQVGVVEEEGRVSLNDLPDELLIQIFNRLIDLKCLCLCSLVSPRFSSLILHHDHSVYFAFPRPTTTTTDAIPTVDNPTTDRLDRKNLCCAVSFLSKFKSVRSLHLVFPSRNDDSLFFKWTAKFSHTLYAFVFLSTSSIRVGEEFDSDEHEQEAPRMRHRLNLALECLEDVVVWHQFLLFFVRKHPLLQNITITDSKNQGNLSLRDSKVAEMRNLINSSFQSDKSDPEPERSLVWGNVKQWHVPVLKLPVSRKVMVSPGLVLMEMQKPLLERGDENGATISTLFSEQGEVESAEAVVEMMRIRVFRNFESCLRPFSLFV